MPEPKWRVLLIMEQCNPEGPLVSLLAYHFFRELSERVDLTLCTHGRNRENLEKVRKENQRIIYFDESDLSKKYYRFILPLTKIKGAIWPLVHSLTYPIYAEFDRSVYRKFKDKVLQGDFDIVHAMTPIIPRYPVKMIDACQSTPFILGPVNGGFLYPNGSKNRLNILRAFCRLIPGYDKTYNNASKILSGSTHTLHMLKELFNLPDEKIQLFPEKGLLSIFYHAERKNAPAKKPIDLLFVGRLVPHKGAHLILESIAKLPPTIKKKVRVTFVGEGTERDHLDNLAKKLQISAQVTFTGRVDLPKLIEYYQNADLFCYPSLRDSGGMVVLEAMASGVPCLVVDNGGVSEYVTSRSGFKIRHLSNEYIIKEMVAQIIKFIQDPILRSNLSKGAFERAKEFEWGKKIDALVKIYGELITKISGKTS